MKLFAPLVIALLLALSSAVSAQDRYAVPQGIKSLEIDGRSYRVPREASHYALVNRFHLPGTAVVPGVRYERLQPGQASFRGSPVPRGATHAYSEFRFYREAPDKPGIVDRFHGDDVGGTVDIPVSPGPSGPSSTPSTPTRPSSPLGPLGEPPAGPLGETQPTQPTRPSQPQPTQPRAEQPQPTQPRAEQPRPTQPEQPRAEQPVDFKRGACYVMAGNSAGSGTIVGSYPANGRYANIIVTAGHTFDGVARQRITVKDRDLQTIGTAQLIRYSLERRNPREHDLALLLFYTDRPLPVTRVARTGPQSGDRVAIVGKSYLESEMTVHHTVTGEDDYWGSRPRTSTRYIPVSGHSGGGLLNARGELVGVVSGGNGRHGLHTPLAGVHAWLDQAGLSSLYR